MMPVILWILGTASALVAVFARLTGIAPTRVGACFYFPNILYDLVLKRLHAGRWAVDLTIWAAAIAFLLLAGAPWWLSVLLVPLVGACLELYVRRQERRLVNSVYAHKDTRRAVDESHQSHPGARPRPSVQPELVINLIGPFVRRFPCYDLGHLVAGQTVAIRLIIGNHSLVPAQAPVQLSASGPGGFEVRLLSGGSIPPLRSGGWVEQLIRITALKAGPGGRVVLQVRHADEVETVIVQVRSVLDRSARVVRAWIERYPGASRSSFAWRGDMDLYDTATFQSIEGLAQPLELARRYGFPQTCYLSTRLSLEEQSLSEYYAHFGVSRGQGNVSAFIEWLNQTVELKHSFTYPYQSTGKRFALEFGNHMHLHYGTDAAASPDNGWSLMAGIGAGKYPWSSGESSLEEQRDNGLRARALMERYLRFTPKSWAMPDSTNDKWTAAAVEAAGCDVLSDSDATHAQNVIFQPPPHHPHGTKAAELTKRYPGDPQDYIHYSMFLYWLHRGHRRRIPVVFMCHQHLRQYEGYACARLTEAVMRYVLTRFNGDFHINTVYGVGIYWRDVLSPMTRKVQVECSEGMVKVANRGTLDFEDVPVDLEYSDGRRTTVLVDLPAGSEIAIDPVSESQVSEEYSASLHGNPTIPA